MPAIPAPRRATAAAGLRSGLQRLGSPVSRELGARALRVGSRRAPGEPRVWEREVRRFHLFEFEDQPWLPQPFRDFITDHLRYTVNEDMRRPVNLAIAGRLKALLERTGTRRIVDLGAGAGGPLVKIARILVDELNCPVEIVLTDLYPNAAAFGRIESQSGGAIKARYESTSAFDVPFELDGVRTLFTAFHHFRPEEARLVLADAVRKRAPIAVFEPL